MNDMTHAISASAKKAPEHVPPEMIRNHEIYYLPGSVTNTFNFLRTVHEDSDIFYNLNADPIVCPNGAWYVSSFQLMNEVFQDAETFSNHEQSKYSQLVGEDWPMIPVELDAPEHTRIRMVVMPMFSPARMKLLTDRVIERAEELIANFKDKGECDLVAEFSSILPVKIFLELLDLPFERFNDFTSWGNGIINSFIPEERTEATRAARAYLRDVIAERRQNMGDDVISNIVAAKAADGKPLTEDELIGLTFMLFIGGLDTVAATLGFIFRYLADHPEARAQLREQPDLIPTAVEEFLRAFSVVQSKRKVTRDIDFHGAPMKAGDYVTCVTGLADTDPEEFGEGVQLDRQNNRHMAFGMGPHRCLGSHLARLELKLAIEVWLKAIPDFEIVPGAKITTHGAGGVYGYDSLPLHWSKGATK
jgi:cytochrome P450